MKKTQFSHGEETPERVPGLESLYNSDWLDTPDKEEFLYPISHMLEDVPEHYTDEVFIKAGGEKRIFTVRDLRTDRVVALARPVDDASGEQKERFLREARLTACLQHPNIISVYDIGLDVNSEAFFTMEYVRGDTLREIVEKLDAQDPGYMKRFPLPRLLELFTKVCDAVSYAHSRNVVHLDLKPSNIFVGPFGEVLVCDWGLAKIVRSDEPLTQRGAAVPSEELPNGDILNDLTNRGTIKGTPGFMAPEQVGKSQQVSTRTDVYSLGALLYYILAHRPCLAGDSMSEMAELTLNGKIVPPSKLRLGHRIPPGLEAVVMKALARDPGDRYRSVGKFRDEVDRYLLGFAPEAQHAGWGTQLLLLARRRKIAFRVAMFSFAVLCVIVALAFVKVLGEKRVAEENLRLYIEETEYSRKLSDTIRETAMDLINAEDFLHAEGKIKAIESHLAQETDPDKVYALTEYLALLHFVLQEFNQAVEYFGRIEVHKRYQDCAELSAKYARIKPDDERWLEPDDMCDLLFEVKRHVRAVNYYLAYYYLKKSIKRPANEILPVVETVLDILSFQSFSDIETPTLQATQDERGWHLSLKGSPYAIFQIPIAVPMYESNVLKPLRLYSLDVSHSAFNDIERLHGIALKELNIAGIREIPKHKMFMFERLKVERVFHTLDHTDDYLAEHAPGVKFVRVEQGM